MGQIAKRVEDKRLLKLIRAFLNAGVMENGLVSPSVEGTPQGGPLSPLLSNLVLDALDHELEHRGHRFVRYADDCNIYVRSERAGQRVMKRQRVRWHDRRNGSFSGSASRLVRTPSARSRQNLWNGSSGESGRSREGPRALASRRQWKSWLRICGAGAAISASAKRPRCWSLSLAGSGCGWGPLFGVSGKHHGVAERHWSR